MNVQRRYEIKLEDVNLFNPDTSADMFYGQFVKTFPHPRKGEPDVSFIYRKCDPGTLLELTDTALLIASDRAPSEEEVAQGHSPSSLVEQFELAQVRMTHRLEVLQKCICAPSFKNLEQLKKIPSDWQIELYNLIMHGVLGEDVLTARRFQEEDAVVGA